MSGLLEVTDLRVEFGALTAVAGVSFRVDAGETYAIVGESGSGKTTVIRAVAGLLPSQGGSVRFQGRELRGMTERAFRPLRRDMAMTFQDPVGSLSPRLTVRSIVTEPYRIQGMKDQDLEAEAKRLLGMVGLTEDIAGRYPYQLSGGQACRVGVARALALEPKLILADEPTAGLDVSVQGELLNLLNDLRRRLGLAMAIITTTSTWCATSPTGWGSCISAASSKRGPPRRYSPPRVIPTPSAFYLRIRNRTPTPASNGSRSRASRRASATAPRAASFALAARSHRRFAGSLPRGRSPVGMVCDV